MLVLSKKPRELNVKIVQQTINFNTQVIEFHQKMLFIYVNICVYIK